MSMQLPENPMFPPGFTAYHLLDMVLDHTAHHRGVLVSYARGLGRRTVQPWMSGEHVKGRQRVMLARGAADAERAVGPAHEERLTLPPESGVRLVRPEACAGPSAEASAEASHRNDEVAA
jgi:hypothetical protein